ncbi:inositol monophosphatase family protein [Arenibaculum pallidiluteum]|uniref:inositol monophosphatase family protein n=1 Tax=Arenibaculum pallidiluteum TaxID=2812559 RepID=UPI001A96FFD4|nr:inositol monophosphatase [Arenibaculum pallidiluteum]
MIPDPDRVSTAMRDVAQAEILPRFRSLSAEDVREKGPGDLVTIADEAAELVLSARLQEILPGSIVVGEEAVAADASVLDGITGDAPVWVVDPIDGTYNFAHGHPVFGVMVALVQGGVPVAGWIHDPCGDRTAWVVKGQGAWMGGRRLSVASPAALTGMKGFLSTRFYAPAVREALDARKPRVASAESLLCAAHEYLRLVAGDAHFAVYRRIMPWDHLAGTLMVEEAGGYCARFDGTPYTATTYEGGLLVAPDEASWRLLHENLLKGAVPEA